MISPIIIEIGIIAGIIIGIVQICLMFKRKPKTSNTNANTNKDKKL